MDYRQYLIEHDLKDQLEGPDLMNYDRLRNDIQKVLDELKSRVFPDAKLEGWVQDATYQEGIILELGQHEKAYYQSSIRFSNFGRMAAYTNPDFENRLEHPALLKILEDNEFVFIPNQYLEVDYHGINKQQNVETWWIRYFDYI